MSAGGESLDYVVFGIGSGATLLVLGLVIRDFGPLVRHRASTDPDRVFHAEELVARVSWGRFCGALGAVLALGGTLILIATVICMYLMVADSTGGWVMAVSFLALMIVVAFWTWAFFDRFGSYGILPERDDIAEDPVSETDGKTAARPADAETIAGVTEPPNTTSGGSPEPETDRPGADRPEERDGEARPLESDAPVEPHLRDAEGSAQHAPADPHFAGPPAPPQLVKGNRSRSETKSNEEPTRS